MVEYSLHSFLHTNIRCQKYSFRPRRKWRTFVWFADTFYHFCCMAWNKL